MKENVLLTYEINSDTIALLPAFHHEYHTIVIERNDTLYIKQTPMEIIKEACLEGGSTYEGRRMAVSNKTGIHNKIPIPIHPQKGIYAFPTLSPRHFECIWIFQHHIKSIKKDAKSHKCSIIVFKTYQELTVNITYSILENQMLRTAYCMTRFSRVLV